MSAPQQDRTQPLAWVDIAAAAEVIAGGGVIAYPTEAVYGLGCDPFAVAAVERIIELKGRGADKGMIVVAADVAQVAAWLDPERGADELARVSGWPGPVTWIFSAGPAAPQAVARPDRSIAIRVSAHPTVRALCAACGPLVSTSANLSGAAPIRDKTTLERDFGAQGVALVSGELGGLERPSRICDARTGEIIRHG